MKKHYTIQVNGLILGQCSGTMRDALHKAGRLAGGYTTDVDIYQHTSTRITWLASVSSAGAVSYAEGE